MVVAAYDTTWQNLSAQHEVIHHRVVQAIDDYAAGKSNPAAHCLVGTYGAGKTQLLYQIHKLALERRLLPAFFIAEDLFREVITGNQITPGELHTVVREKIQRLKSSVSASDGTEVRRILDPRNKLGSDTLDLVDQLRPLFGTPVENLRVVVLIDELEGQYGVLQERVSTRDQSPLREWLEDKTELKFLAFAPASIYELGGADRGRLMRIVLPSADMEYVRSHLVQDPGRSNSLWWLSRGKARQLFKTHLALLGATDLTDAASVSRLVNIELDSIGQPPTEVPAAVTDKVPPEKVPWLVALSPVKTSSERRFVIDSKGLETGALAGKLVDAFHISKDNALTIADYFRRTVRSLSDQDWMAYVGSDELPELFALTFDHLLEYEHGSPQMSANLGEVLNLYERVRKENAGLYGIVARLWDQKEADSKLPLSIKEIRDAFPFPSMNPIVKSHIPEKVKETWLGRGLPIWQWNKDGVDVSFFASEKDFAAYSEKDLFLSKVIPDGKGLLVVFPSDQDLDNTKPLLQWLNQNGKLNSVQLPSLLSDFLLSAAGEIKGDETGNLQEVMEALKQEKEDILLSRKAEIYSEAISDLIREEIPQPNTFFRASLPDAETTWGKGQMDRDVSIMGLSLGFTDINVDQREILRRLRELFKSGKGERGIGELNPLVGRVGYASLSDDLLPRLDRRKVLKDSEPVGRIKAYWPDSERKKLIDLARILRLEDFLKLQSDEDMNRLLEALWRSERKDYDSVDVAAVLQKLEGDVRPALEAALQLETNVKQVTGSGGINFGFYETVVKAKGGIDTLIALLKESNEQTGSNAALLQHIVGSIADTTANSVSRDVRQLSQSASSCSVALQEFKKASDDLKKNFWEYERAAKFAGVSQARLGEEIAKQTSPATHTGLSDLETGFKEKKEYLATVSSRLASLQKALDNLEGLFEGASS